MLFSFLKLNIFAAFHGTASVLPHPDPSLAAIQCSTKKMEPDSIDYERISITAQKILRVFSAGSAAALNARSQLVWQISFGHIVAVPFLASGMSLEDIEEFLINLIELWEGAFNEAEKEMSILAETGVAELGELIVAAKPKRTILSITAAEKLLWASVIPWNAPILNALFSFLDLPSEMQNSINRLATIDKEDEENHETLAASAMLLHTFAAASLYWPRDILSAVNGLFASDRFQQQLRTAALPGSFWTRKTLECHIVSLPAAPTNKSGRSGATVVANVILNPDKSLLATDLLKMLPGDLGWSLCLALLQNRPENGPIPEISARMLQNWRDKPSFLSPQLLEALHPPWLRSILRAIATSSAIAPIISQSDRVSISTELMSYLGLTSIEALNAHFVTAQMIAPGHDVSTVISNDFAELGRLGIDADVLSSRFSTCILAAWCRHIAQANADNDLDPVGTPKIYPDYQQYFNTWRLKEMQHALQKAPHPAPEHVVSAIYVSGLHHRDPLHPSLDTFYLDSDTVGGCSDCLIVNKNLTTYFAHCCDEATLESALQDRFNSKAPAEWEADPGVIYCSDMSPYFVRTCRFFEGPTCRYRVDPRKLAAVLGLT